MEHGFFHPNIGYWQTLTTPTAEQLAGYPSGTVEISLRPDSDHSWDGTKWVYDPAPPYVPTVITMRQARLALLGAGLLSSIETAIESMPSPQKEEVRIEWDYSTLVRRDNKSIQALAAAIGLSDAQLDDLFVSASSL